jgi:hypothetical protein
MDISTTTTTVNTITYRSTARLTAADLAGIAKDLKSRKVPADATITLGTASSLTIRY